MALILAGLLAIQARCPPYSHLKIPGYYAHNMGVAIIGSGISGLSAAYLLAPHAEVTLYEKEGHLGGHADTHCIDTGEEKVAVDTGFMVFNPDQYPHLVSFLDHLGIESVNTSMTFSVSVKNTITYSSKAPSGLLCDKKQLLRPKFYHFLYDIIRFNIKAKTFLKRKNDLAVTLGTFLKEDAFSEEFREWYLYPMLGSIWSCALNELDDYPALPTFRFLNNHKLLNVVFGAQWRTIRGGSITYVEEVRRFLEEHRAHILTNQEILEIVRSEKEVTIVTTEGRETYDMVIMATHADTALSLLKNPSAAEKEILSAFSYSTNNTILHKDRSFMPLLPSAWASWNYFTEKDPSQRSHISLTYNMNALQHIDTKHPMYVTLNPTHDIKEEYVYKRMQYTHPVFNKETEKAQKRLPEIQNKNRTLFVGAHWGFGFHEDGIASALHAVQLLGIQAPWKK